MTPCDLVMHRKSPGLLAELLHDGFAEAKIVRKWRCAPQVMGLALELVGGKEAFIRNGFVPGQWIDYYIPEIDSVGGYSLTSSPLELPTFTLAVKKSNWKPAAWVHEKTEVNQRVFVKPGGNFAWDAAETPRHALMLAGGIGVTPFVSMLQHLSLHRQRCSGQHAASRIALIHSVRHGEHTGSWSSFDAESRFAMVIFNRYRMSWHGPGLEAQLDDIASSMPQHVSYHLHHTDGTGAGRINKKTIQGALACLRKAGNSNKSANEFTHDPAVVSYLCGPPDFLDASEAALLDLGFARGSVLTERWF